jgi:hypothetical protein
MLLLPELEHEQVPERLASSALKHECTFTILATRAKSALETATRRSGETDTIVSRSYSTRIVVGSHAGRIAPSAAEVYGARRQAADADSGAPGGRLGCAARGAGTTRLGMVWLHSA